MQNKQTTITQNVAVVLTANEAAEYYCRSRESDKNNKQLNNEILLSHDFMEVFYISFTKQYAREFTSNSKALWI